jgi:hypothetical protein
MPFPPRTAFASLAAAVILAFVLPSHCRAQTTSGTVVGSVHDVSENNLAGAKITVVNEENGNRRARLTDGGGNFRLFNLPPGLYSVTASREGFIEQTMTHFPIQFNQKNVVRLPQITLRRAALQGSVVDAARATLPDGALTLPVTLRRALVFAPQAASPVIDGERAATGLHLLDPARSLNFTERQLQSLPLGGSSYMRSLDELALLVAGVAPPPYTPGFGFTATGQFSVNGMRARSNNFSTDGSDNNDPEAGARRQGFAAVAPQPLESIKEVSFSTLLWDAELGRNSGAQVNAVTRYGTNAFHGQAYGFFTDSRLNARNFFDTTRTNAGRKSPFTRTQAGFNFGGPLARDRTHFFAAYEHDQTSARTEQHFSTPAPDERRLRDVFTVRLDNFLPGTFQNTTPLGGNVLSLYPLPNNASGPYGANTFSQLVPADGRGDALALKLTHQLSPANLFHARYNLTDDQRVLPSFNRAIRSTLDSRARSQNLSLVLDTELTATVFNQARFSFGRTRLNFLEYPGSPLVFSASSAGTVQTPAGVLPFTSQTGPLGELLIEPYSPVGVDSSALPQRRVTNAFQYADSLSWSAGQHSITFGANIRQFQSDSVQERFYRPRAVYSGALLGNLTGQVIPLSGVEQAAFGIASYVEQSITGGTSDPGLDLRFSESHLFVNDNFRLRPSFTLDFGLRYEYNTVPHEADRRLEDALALTGTPAPGGSVFDTAERTARFNAVVEAYRRVLGGRTRIYDPDRNNFGPHLGFAWSPGGRTVIRGGYGVYYDSTLGAVVSQSRNVFPNEALITNDSSLFRFSVLNLNNPALLGFGTGPIFSQDGRFLPVPCQAGTCNQFAGAPQDFAALLGQLFIQSGRNGLAFTLPEKKLATPYAQQWHLTFEREMFGDVIFSAAYVATKGTKLTRLTTPNFGPNVSLFLLEEQQGLFFAGLVLRGKPNEALGPYQIFEGSGSSTYHAMQFEARNRYSRGVQFTAAYTWSHSIDDISEALAVGGAPQLPQNSVNLRTERGDSNFDVRHRFAASLVWDLPFFGKSRGLRKHLLGGWQLASIFQAHTGQPFTLTLPFDTNLDGNLTDRPSTTAGLIFFDGHGPRRVGLAPGLRFTDFFRFSPGGAVGRNTARGDGFVSLDLAFSKKLRLTERQSLQVRVEIFNALNRANFGLPVGTIGAPGFGAAVDTVGPARIIQFALKYNF